MNHQAQYTPISRRVDLRKGIFARLTTIVVFMAMQAVLLFWSSGRLDWIWAWVYLGICIASLTINALILLRTSPETIAERGRPQETQGWDKIISGIWASIHFVFLPLVAGLDARFGWTGTLGIFWNIAGAVILSAGLALAGWAMIENAYFSTAVRIQSERGQTVCRSGPYRFVRHPGYVGFIGQSLGTPLLLGSLWAFLLGFVAAAFMIIRTAWEDRFLQTELPGYCDYVEEVRFRLVPGIW